MLSTKLQKEICKYYSQLDEYGNKECYACPLCISVTFNMCHANSHYDTDECEFVLDENNMKPYERKNRT